MLAYHHFTGADGRSKYSRSKTARTLTQVVAIVGSAVSVLSLSSLMTLTHIGSGDICTCSGSHFGRGA